MDAEGITVAFLGDSLTEGFGVGPGESFAEELGAMLRDLGRPAQVLNAGVSGDTSGGALRRLPAVLARRPQFLVVEIGVNDFFWGVPVHELESNLRSMATRARQEGARVVLADVRMPREPGQDHSGYSGVFSRVARDLGVPLLAFPLDEVAADPALVLTDGVHPNARGHRRLAEAALPALVEALSEGRRPGGALQGDEDR
jgi:acyl-CoA thioesterase-1